MVVISRNTVFRNGFLSEGSWIRLWYGRHALDRLAERCGGSLLVKPLRVQLTRQTLVKGNLDEGELVSFVVHVPYNDREDLYLVLMKNTVDPRSYFVKSLWFREKGFLKKQRNLYYQNLRHGTTSAGGAGEPALGGCN